MLIYAESTSKSAGEASPGLALESCDFDGRSRGFENRSTGLFAISCEKLCLDFLPLGFSVLGLEPFVMSLFLLAGCGLLENRKPCVIFGKRVS